MERPVSSRSPRNPSPKPFDLQWSGTEWSAPTTSTCSESPFYRDGDYYRDRDYLRNRRTSSLSSSTRRSSIGTSATETLSAQLCGSSPSCRSGSIAPRAISAEIVGVVANEKFWRLDSELRPQAYVNIESQPPNGFDLLLRTSDPEGARERLRTELAPLLPGVPIDNVRRIEDSARATVRGRWLGVAVMNLLATLALALAMIGVHGVLRSTVDERRQELAIRAALGALPSNLLRLVARDGLLLAAAGVALGVLGSLAAGRFLAGYVYSVSATDSLTLAVSGVLLLLFAGVAAWFPARRAGRTEPAAVLREA